MIHSWIILQTLKLLHVHITSKADNVPKKKITIFHLWHVNHLDNVSGYDVYFCHKVVFGLGMPLLQTRCSFLFPESLLTPRLAPGRPFTGCIRHFVIDGRPVSFSKAALVSGAVSINSCPAAWQSRAIQTQSSLEHWKKYKASQEEWQFFLSVEAFI